MASAREQEPMRGDDDGISALEYSRKLIRKQDGGGSYVEGICTIQDLEELFSQLVLVEVFECDMPPNTFSCNFRYFTAILPAEYHAFENIVLLKELSDDEVADVVLKRDENGSIQFYLHRLKPRRTNTLSLVVARNSDSLITWYPGRFTARIDWNSAVNLKDMPNQILRQVRVFRYDGSKIGLYLPCYQCSETGKLALDLRCFTSESFKHVWYPIDPKSGIDWGLATVRGAKE